MRPPHAKPHEHAFPSRKCQPMQHRSSSLEHHATSTTLAPAWLRWTRVGRPSIDQIRDAPLTFRRSNRHSKAPKKRSPAQMAGLDGARKKAYFQRSLHAGAPTLRGGTASHGVRQCRLHMRGHTGRVGSGQTSEAAPPDAAACACAQLIDNVDVAMPADGDAGGGQARAVPGEVVRRSQGQREARGRGRAARRRQAAQSHLRHSALSKHTG